MIKIRNGVFETNSSSMHTLAIKSLYSNVKLELNEMRVTNGKIDIHLGEYGWGVEILKSQIDKLTYIITLIAVSKGIDNFDDLQEEDDFIYVEKQIKEYTGATLNVIFNDDFYIDHQSVKSLNMFLNDDIYYKDYRLYQDEKPELDIKILIFCSDIAIFIMSDNMDIDYFLNRSYFFFDDSRISERLRKNDNLEVLYQYYNGNYEVTLFSDGTKLKTTDDIEFKPYRPENIDLKITNKCNKGCKYCHEGSFINGGHADLFADYLDTFYPGMEVAIGGGNVFEHPDLVLFLNKLKSQNVFPNITVHQDHFLENYEKIKMLQELKLIYGVGVSIVNPTNTLIKKLKTINNVVCHVINGIFNKETFDKLKNNNLKLLILGYKDLRLGETYKTNNLNEVTKNQKWLNDNLYRLNNTFEIVSFDCLGVEQLSMKDKLPKTSYDIYYQGDDGTITYYIDAVNKEFSKSSNSKERFKIENNDIGDMFKKIAKLK